MAPLDREARALILGAAKRVSIVTAVSPRALVDLGYVVYESSRLVRGMAELYGGRPGKIGMLRLMRDVIAHLAVTGSIAMGDSLVQQVLGHGIASKLSARLGEGVINGLMTARIGIAAMDLCRPMPFRALKRPGIGYADLVEAGAAVDPQVAEQVEIQIKYAGYIDRQAEDIERLRRHENTVLPADFDFDAVDGLSNEVRHKLSSARPQTLAQASRIPGVTPAAVSLLLIYLKKRGLLDRKIA